MDNRCTAMTAMLPPFRAWSILPENICAPDEIRTYWPHHDALTFLADTGMYDTSMDHELDTAEKDHAHQFKSVYFKKRFAVSRSILRHILHHLLETENDTDIILTREKNGRIRVNNRPDIFVSLSYSCSRIAVTVGKRKVGSDIEMVRPIELQKIRSSPLLSSMTSKNRNDSHQHLLHIWTLLEAYAKLRDMSLYPLSKDRFLLSDAHFASYLIDECFILTLASDSRTMKDKLLWIDPGCRQSFSRALRKTSQFTTVT